MGKLYHSCHVTFDENLFPFTKTTFVPLPAAAPCPITLPPPPVPPVTIDEHTTTPVMPAVTTPVIQSPSPGMSSPVSTSNSSN